MHPKKQETFRATLIVHRPVHLKTTRGIRCLQSSATSSGKHMMQLAGSRL